MMGGTGFDPLTVRSQRQLIDQFNRVRNLTPGRKVSEDLERIAEELEGLDQQVDQEFGVSGDPPSGVGDDADLLRRLAVRLRELRTVVRGPGRNEQDREVTKAAIEESLAAGGGAPFYTSGQLTVIHERARAGDKKRSE
jgi:hypothetical protein